MSEEIRANVPYVKSYDAKGDLINPILFKYQGLGPNRRQRRKQEGKTSSRPFNNKKGIQLIIAPVGPAQFMKFEKVIIKQGETGTRLMIKERIRKQNR